MLTSFKLKHNQTVTDFLKVTLGVNKMVRKYQTHAIFVSPIKGEPDKLNIKFAESLLAKLNHKAQPNVNQT